MIDALYNGISGLNIYQKALDSESNNIANVNTVSYKADQVTFADMMYQKGFGKGANIVSIGKDFKQGSMKITGNAYDMAIAGDGYFTVTDVNKNIFYTRAGNFRMGTDGTLQTPDGLKVQGLGMQAPSIVGTNPNTSVFGDTHTNFLATQNINSATQMQTINAKATDFQSTATTSGTSGNNYKTASSKISDIEALTNEYKLQLGLYSNNPIAGSSSVPQTSVATFDTSMLNGTSDNVSIFVDNTQYLQSFDTDKKTTLNKLSDQISKIKGFTSSVDTTTGELTITSLIPGKFITIGTAKVNDSNMNTKTTVTPVSGNGLASLTSVKDALKKAIEGAGAEFLEITSSINLADQQTLTLQDIQLKLDALNLTTVPFGDISVDNGAIYMKQGNSKFIVGKVVTATFNDSISLDPQGGNRYRETKLSGKPIFAGSINNIQNKTLELSNSELSEGLVNLMVYQRSFEANSKSVTTSDELLKTAIQLKK